MLQLANPCVTVLKAQVELHAHVCNICMLLQEVLRQPVIAADGHTYEKTAIEAWLLQHNASPVTQLAFAHFCLVPNLSIRGLILSNVESA